MMSKGWYVKVGTQIVINIDTNIGVLASSEEQAGAVAQEIVSNNLDKSGYLAELSEQISWEFDLRGMHWCRSGSPDIDFDTMQALSVTPDSDFDPEPDHDDEDEAATVRCLMEAAQCLNEAFHGLPEDHPLQKFREQYGIAEVREQLNLIAIYCDKTHRVMTQEQGYDLCFDFDFVPQFLENCVTDDFEPKSENPHILSMYWSAF